MDFLEQQGVWSRPSARQENIWVSQGAQIIRSVTEAELMRSGSQKSSTHLEIKLSKRSCTPKTGQLLIFKHQNLILKKMLNFKFWSRVEFDSTCEDIDINIGWCKCYICTHQSKYILLNIHKRKINPRRVGIGKMKKNNVLHVHNVFN